MAAPNSQPAQQQGAVTAPRSPRGAPGYAVAAPKQGAVAMEAPPPSSPQGAPGFAVVPQGASHAAAPDSPQGPPGFWLAPQQAAPAPPQGASVAPEQAALALPQGAPVAPEQAALAPPQGASVMVAPQGATMMAQQQQHFAPVMVPGSQQDMQMAVQAASMDMNNMMMASMPLQLQAQAQAMAAYQQAQGMVPSQSLPTYPPMTEMQQAQAGYMMATPPLSYGPPPLMQQQQQQQQFSQADPAMMTQPPLPLGPPPVVLQQQPAQGGVVMMAQPPPTFSSPSVLQQQQQPQGNQMMMGHPQLSALPCKRQRVDQYDNPYGQHMAGHQQETAMFNAAMGQSFGTNFPTEFPSFGAPMPSLPTDATSTVYVEGLPNNCTRREVAHIFRQYMGFREVRLVSKSANRHAICFVDFATPTHAFLAMRTLQGYRFDEQDPWSRNLNLQFSHSPRMASHGGC